MASCSRTRLVSRLRHNSSIRLPHTPSVHSSRAFHQTFHVGTKATSTTSATGSLTPVEKIILDGIKATGPITFANYMQMCLSHPTEGYYMKPTNPVFGSKGDFVTSPEISQTFGELIAVWLYSQFTATTSPKPVRLIELGPGRGTLMKDVIRVLLHFLGPKKIKEVHLVETSPSMRDIQESSLRNFANEHGFEILWHTTIDDIPQNHDQFTMILSHEFFDALPFHLIEKTPKGWQEVLIASTPDPAKPLVLTPSLDKHSLSPSPTVGGPRFCPVLSPTPSLTASLLGNSSPRFEQYPIGSQLEVSIVSYKIAQQIAALLQNPQMTADSPGCGLIIDYGGDKSYGKSFRAFKKHNIVDVFHQPGQCDLTVNVDFAYLREAISKHALALGPTSQANYLTSMGIELRINRLLQSAKSEERKKVIEDSARRLVDPIGMGSQYQVMGVWGRFSGNPAPGAGYPFVSPEEVGIFGQETGGAKS